MKHYSNDIHLACVGLSHSEWAYPLLKTHNNYKHTVAYISCITYTLFTLEIDSLLPQFCCLH